MNDENMAISNNKLEAIKVKKNSSTLLPTSIIMLVGNNKTNCSKPNIKITS